MEGCCWASQRRTLQWRKPSPSGGHVIQFAGIARVTVYVVDGRRAERILVHVVLKERLMSISVILAILALLVAIINAFSGRAPLWIAVALLALAIIVPGVLTVR